MQPTIPIFDTTGTCRIREPGTGALSVLFAGDTCPPASGQKIVEEGRIETIISAIKPIFQSSDLRIIQWETPLATHGKQTKKAGPRLGCDPICAELAASLEIDVALLANNHIGDQGADATLSTLDEFARRGIHTVGAGADETLAGTPLHLTIKKRKIIIINVAEHEFGIATPCCPGAAGIRPLKNISQISEARKNADIVIMTIHGGHELNPYPSPRMQEWYRAFADAGADIVFNCHTHCPEGIEFWNGTPIVYCPGNFYFPNPPSRITPPVWNTGYLPRITLDGDGVCEIQIVPYSFTEQAITPLTGDERASFLQDFEALCTPLSDPQAIQHFFDVWSATSAHANAWIDGLSRIGKSKWKHAATTKIKQALVRIGLRPEALLTNWCIGHKNTLFCESHLDTVRRNLSLKIDSKLESLQDDDAVAVIQRTQNPKWMNRSTDSTTRDPNSL